VRHMQRPFRDLTKMPGHLDGFTIPQCAAEVNRWKTARLEIWYRPQHTTVCEGESTMGHLVMIAAWDKLAMCIVNSLAASSSQRIRKLCNNRGITSITKVQTQSHYYFKACSSISSSVGHDFGSL
jgi:hypothetical protein